MNRLGPPVSGETQKPVTARLGPAVKNVQGGNSPKGKGWNKNKGKGASPIKASALKTNKAGQVFYDNVKVFFKDGKIFDTSGKILSIGGKVNFQNGRLEYVGGSKVQAEVKGKTTGGKIISKSPISAPTKTPPAKNAPVKSAPAKTPITAPATSPAPETENVVSVKKAKLKGVVGRLGPVVNNGEIQTTEPIKKVKEMKELPQMKNLVVQSIINASPNRNSIDLVCGVPGVNEKAIIKLEKAPFGKTVNEVQKYLKSSTQVVSWKNKNMAKIILSNTGTFDSLNAVNAEVTYPATNSKITNLKKSCPPRMLRETPEYYRQKVMPYIRQWLPANEPQKWMWIDEILNGNIAPDRLIDVHKPEGRPQHGFTLVKDVKWKDDKNVDDLHILGIARRKDIFCLRDLTGDDVPLLKGMYHVGTSIIRERYGIPVEDQLVFLLYYPSTYHLHVHFTTWGKYEELGRLGVAHLLVDVISNLEDIDPNYYRKVTLNVLVDKNYEFLNNTQEGTQDGPLRTSGGSRGPLLGVQPQKPVPLMSLNNGIGHLQNNVMPQQPPFGDPVDPFYRIKDALLDLLNRFQEVLNGDLEFLRLPIKELMKHIFTQPREVMNNVKVPLKELLHHLQNRPLDHMPQVESVLADLLQFFQKFPSQKLHDPVQNQKGAMQTNQSYLRGYEMPRYHM